MHLRRLNQQRNSRLAYDNNVKSLAKPKCTKSKSLEYCKIVRHKKIVGSNTIVSSKKTKKSLWEDCQLEEEYLATYFQVKCRDSRGVVK